ncbi:MAG: hypothetical protein ACT4QE_00910 [Anaerolineales bacterium]
METLFSNPAGLILGLCLLGTVFGPLLGIIIMLRGGRVDVGPLRRFFVGEAEVWRKAATGNSTAQQQQSDQFAELHRRVNELKSGNEPDPKSEI